MTLYQSGYLSRLCIAIPGLLPLAQQLPSADRNATSLDQTLQGKVMCVSIGAADAINSDGDFVTNLQACHCGQRNAPFRPQTGNDEL